MTHLISSSTGAPLITADQASLIDALQTDRLQLAEYHHTEGLQKTLHSEARASALIGALAEVRTVSEARERTDLNPSVMALARDLLTAQLATARWTAVVESAIWRLRFALHDRVDRVDDGQAPDAR